MQSHDKRQLEKRFAKVNLFFLFQGDENPWGSTPKVARSDSLRRWLFAFAKRAERSECRDLRSKRVQMGKKSIYYGSVSSLSFRFFVFAHSVLFRFFRRDGKIAQHPLESITLFRRRIIAQSQRIIAFSRKRIKRLRIHGFSIYF